MANEFIKNLSKKKLKPETIIRNQQKEIDKLRALCIGLGCPMLIAYCPDYAINKGNLKIPRKLTKEQANWLKARFKEFNKMLKNDK